MADIDVIESDNAVDASASTSAAAVDPTAALLAHEVTREPIVIKGAGNMTM